MNIQQFKDNLLEFLNEQIADEKENIREAQKNGDGNSVGCGMSIGAVDAYKEVLDFVLEAFK